MKNYFDPDRLVAPLLDWYASHARDLPWRRDVTPYRVWVSEIMLQQTRVETVKPYFERFMAALPTIRDLAECDETRLLKLWEGLGYYSRVRNMQTAAREVLSFYDGCLPADFTQLLSLKGIGRYTAGAIASIAFGIPVPAVDGNVLRIIMRVTADDSDITRASVRSDVEHFLQGIMPAGQAGAFNQALMELGATVCLPNGEPLCGECPWHSLCEAMRQGIWSELPVKKKPPARRIEDRTVLLVRDDDHILLCRRANRGLLAGMYEFPNREGHLSPDEAAAAVRDMHLSPLRIRKLENAKHIFSHVEWHMTGYMIQVDSLTREEAGLLFVEIGNMQAHYPIPSAFAAYAGYLCSNDKKEEADAAASAIHEKDL